LNQGGNIRDILVRRRGDKPAAKEFFRKLLKGLTDVPPVLIMEKLKVMGPLSESYCLRLRAV
jgi:putative transposase